MSCFFAELNQTGNVGERRDSHMMRLCKGHRSERCVCTSSFCSCDLWPPAHTHSLSFFCLDIWTPLVSKNIDPLRLAHFLARSHSFPKPGPSFALTSQTLSLCFCVSLTWILSLSPVDSYPRWTLGCKAQVCSFTQTLSLSFSQFPWSVWIFPSECAKSLWTPLRVYLRSV